MLSRRGIHWINIVFAGIAAALMVGSLFTPWTTASYLDRVSTNAKVFTICVNGVCDSWSHFLKNNVGVTLCTSPTDPSWRSLLGLVHAVEALVIASIVATIVHALLISWYSLSVTARICLPALSAILALLLDVSGLIVWAVFVNSCSTSLCDVRYDFNPSGTAEGSSGASHSFWPMLCLPTYGIWMGMFAGLMVLVSAFGAFIFRRVAVTSEDEHETAPLVAEGILPDPPRTQPSVVVDQGNPKQATLPLPEYYAPPNRQGYNEA